MKRFYQLLFLISLSVMLNACSLAYKGTGKVMIGYAEEQGVPYMLAAEDVSMKCAMVESFTPFLLSFSQVTRSPDQLAILFYLMAGNCTEFKAWEEELRYLRAVQTKNPAEAKDARISQQRLLAQAASRQLTGYQYLGKAYAEPGGKCPEFSTDQDELYWLVGLLDGMQAIINDIASAGRVAVPMDIAAKVGRGAACLDNEKWWGTPSAIQAAIWMTIPGGQPKDKNPEQILKQSVQMGLQQGIRIPQVLAAQVYLGKGNIAEVKQIIRNHAGLMRQTALSDQFKSLNEVANLQIRAISDRLWTEATGARTPIGKIGHFWDDADQVVETVDIDELL